jgi:site-specific recombinase XerD
MKVNEALAKFLVQLEADGRSSHTIGQYRRHVTAFSSWLAHGGVGCEIAAVGHEQVAAFLAAPEARVAAHGKPKCAISMNAMRTSLRVFFRYLHEAGEIESNPARLVRRAICGVSPPRSLSEPERDRLLATLAAGDCPRDHALFHLMLATGIRVGSAVAIDVGDVDFERGEIRLKTMKGGRSEVVYLGREIAAHLRTYIGDRKAGPLFPGRGSERITTRHVQRRMGEWLKKAGIKSAASPHWLRHGFATDLLKRTGDLALVQAALCHRSITSTLVYARVDAGRVRAALG